MTSLDRFADTTAWDRFADTFLNTAVMAKYLPDILDGFWLTV